MPLIRGRVVDRAGHPVAGARVMVTEGPAPMPDIAMLTGEDGRFAMAVPVPGRWRLLAATDDARAEADVDASGGPADAMLVLPRS